jgi:hypothetical protein
MKREREDATELGGEDARFVERLRALYAPEPPDAARRAAFDARLRERLERRRWRAALWPALPAAALAAALVWVALPGARAPQRGEPAPVAALSPADTAWEQALFYGDPASVPDASENQELPPEYTAIEVAFFDGT